MTSNARLSPSRHAATSPASSLASYDRAAPASASGSTTLTVHCAGAETIRGQVRTADPSAMPRSLCQIRPGGGMKVDFRLLFVYSPVVPALEFLRLRQALESSDSSRRDAHRRVACSR